MVNVTGKTCDSMITGFYEAAPENVKEASKRQCVSTAYAVRSIFCIPSDDENKKVKTMRERGRKALVKIPPAFWSGAKGPQVMNLLSTLNEGN